MLYLVLVIFDNLHSTMELGLIGVLNDRNSVGYCRYVGYKRCTLDVVITSPYFFSRNKQTDSKHTYNVHNNDHYFG